MLCGVNMFLFLGAIGTVITRFFTIVVSALTGLILGILARVVLQAVLLIFVLSFVVVFVVALVASTMSVVFVAMTAFKGRLIF